MKKSISSILCSFVIILSINTITFAQTTNWEQVGDFTDIPVNSISEDSNGSLFAGTYAGVYRSDDNGKNWHPTSFGLADTNVNVININSSDEIFAGTYGGIFYSNNEAASWEKRNNGLRFKKIRTMIIDDNDHVYIGASDSANGVPGSLFSSTDDGNSWIEIKEGLFAEEEIVKDFVKDLNNTVYAVTNGGGIIQSEFMYKWNNQDQQWQTIFRYPPNLEINRLHRSLGDIFYAGESHGMIRSDDKGVSWEAAGLYPRTVLSIATISDSVIFAGTYYYGVFHSADSGNTWHHLGLPEMNIIELKITKSGHLLAGTEFNGLFRQKEVVTSNDESGFGEVLPKTFSLEQNFPNPFNPTTRIRYYLPTNSSVQLDVFNITGQKVATLVDNQLKPAGTYQVNFDASNLTSGIYLYRLIAGEYTQIKKMTLIK